MGISSRPGDIIVQLEDKFNRRLAAVENHASVNIELLQKKLMALESLMTKFQATYFQEQQSEKVEEPSCECHIRYSSIETAREHLSKHASLAGIYSGCCNSCGQTRYFGTGSTFENLVKFIPEYSFDDMNLWTMRDDPDPVQLSTAEAEGMLFRRSIK